MSRNWIVVGDKTNHGGTVITGSPFTDVDGYPMARVGDQVSCPQCGPTTIATGDPTRIIDGKPMARHDDKTACGAKLIAGKQFRGFTEESGAASSSGTTVAALFAQQNDGQPVAPRPRSSDTNKEEAGRQSPVSTGLGADVDELAGKSPSLQAGLRELKEKGWVVRYGPAGEGSYTNKEAYPPEIVIDGAERRDAGSVVQTLAHEVGHAKYEYVADYSSRQTYLDGVLSGEGAATINNIAVQREILDAGGGDIGIAGAAENHGAYERAYDEFIKNGNREAAESAIGKIFGVDEISSVKVDGKSVNYNEYYGGWYDENYGP